MELFPERDGNGDQIFVLLGRDDNTSEWSSSLKGMETSQGRREAKPNTVFVRMELFPERDGNLRDPKERTTTSVVLCPNGALP